MGHLYHGYVSHNQRVFHEKWFGGTPMDWKAPDSFIRLRSSQMLSIFKRALNGQLTHSQLRWAFSPQPSNLFWVIKQLWAMPLKNEVCTHKKLFRIRKRLIVSTRIQVLKIQPSNSRMWYVFLISILYRAFLYIFDEFTIIFHSMGGSELLK